MSCAVVFFYFYVSLQGIDVKSMGRIFIGLVKCGAWGCFDEFNRLEEEVMSAVSMQIQTIQAAVRNHVPAIQLLDKEVLPNAFFSYLFHVMKTSPFQYV